jgi:hypothetical protein
MGAAAGVSHESVHRIWKNNDLKPRLRRTFKISNDPQFEQKFWDAIGLYSNPPDKALVLCCDEKSQCQALERTQRDCLWESVISAPRPTTIHGTARSPSEARHTQVEWLRFLKQLDRETPPDLTIHLIIDHYAAPKHAKVKAWLLRHPRFVIHFTPTGSSWMNLVERFFAGLTADCVREGSFANVRELIDAIDEFLEVRNEAPKRYVWRAKGEDILLGYGTQGRLLK